jgi:hypothetical protein
MTVLGLSVSTVVMTLFALVMLAATLAQAISRARFFRGDFIIFHSENDVILGTSKVG